MDDNRFWLRIVGIAAIAFCVMVGSCSGLSAYQAGLVADMVKEGADPIRARCAMSDSNYNSVLCASLR